MIKLLLLELVTKSMRIFIWLSLLSIAKRYLIDYVKWLRLSIGNLKIIREPDITFAA
jgi:hypothetical protein